MSKINETNYPRRTQASYEDTDMLVIQESGGNTYTTRIEDLREDCQETLAPALNTMRENLATVEGSTASKAYAKGDFLVFGGRLCKAKTSIASGATLVLDTNIELDSVGDELSSISSDLTSLITETFTCTSGTPSLLAISYNKATLRRYGKIGIVEIEAWSQAEIAVGATINITITGLKIAAGTNGCTYSGYGIIGYSVSSTNNGNDVLISARYFASNIPASYQEMFRFAVLLA